MNNRKSFVERMLVFSLLYFAAWIIFQNYWGKKQNSDLPAQPAQTLVQAWAGIAPDNGTKLTPQAATSEISNLQKRIKGNGSDDYSYWARLRSGLIQQYGLAGKPDLAAARKNYEEVINHGASDDIDAQALYQDGDALWRDSRSSPEQIPQGEKLKPASIALERLIHRGRGASVFLEKKIYVPSTGGSEIGAPLLSATALPPAFALVSVADLEEGQLGPQVSILKRVDAYYTTTWWFFAFNTISSALGNNPKFSYGLAIVLFAITTRVLMQPLTRKQYDSMKGMSVIAPEMKRIQERYKDNKDQAQQIKMMGEIKELQKRHGVNPSMGCVLALPSMLLFLGVISPFIQANEAHLQLVGASFAWIHNLARPDIPLLILYTLSQFLSIRLSATAPTDDQQRQMQMMSTFMPIIFAFFLLSWPSAFTLYWMTYNVLSTAFQWRLLKASDPTKNILKTLTTSPFTIVSATGDVPGEAAVPARPKPLATKTHIKTLNPTEKAIVPRKKANTLESNGTGDYQASALNGTLNSTSSAFSNAAAGQSDWDGEESEAAMSNGAFDEETAKNGANANKNASTQRARRRRRH